MTISGIGELPLFKRRSSGTQELEALLDLLPQPTLIADAHTRRILFANAQATQLSAYTRHELGELDLPTLLPDLNSEDLHPQESRPSPRPKISHAQQPPDPCCGKGR